MKACPFCAEEIQDAAIVCKHCGHDLVVTPVPATIVPVASPPTPFLKQNIGARRSLTAVAIGVGVIASMMGSLGFGVLAIWTGLIVGLTGSWIVRVGGGLIMSTIIGSIAFAVAGNSPSSMSSSHIGFAAARVVEYRVSGTAGSASVTYRNASGGTEQRHDVTLPWTFSLGQMPRGSFLYISAQGKSSMGGTVIAEIVVDDDVVKRSESEGAYSIASASGLY